MPFFLRDLGSKRVSSKKDQAALAHAEQLGVADWHRPRSDIELGKKIGAGSFGEVFKCRIRGSRQEWAAKVMDPASMPETEASLLEMEVKIWSQLDHPAVVKFLGVCLEPKEYILLCALCPGGSLADRHRFCRRNHLPPPETTEFISQAKTIAGGMTYLHDQQVIHRDLKSHNILIGEHGQLLIADFGVSRFQHLQSKAEMTAETGTYRWMAPEVVRHEPYDKSCDVYSYGILCWEMLTYRLPFEWLSSIEAADAAALHNKRPHMPMSCRPEVAELLQLCWSTQSERRPTFRQIQETLDKILIRYVRENGSQLDEPTPMQNFLDLQGQGREKVGIVAGAADLKPSGRRDSQTSVLSADTTHVDLPHGGRQSLYQKRRRSSAGGSKPVSQSATKAATPSMIALVQGA